MSVEEKKLRGDIESYLRGEEPTAAELGEAPNLYDWDTEITPAPGGGYCLTLVGRVTGHPLLPDGKKCTTSKIVWLDRNCRFARSKNRLWRLGDLAVVDGGDA